MESDFVKVSTVNEILRRRTWARLRELFADLLIQLLPNKTTVNGKKCVNWNSSQLAQPQPEAINFGLGRRHFRCVNRATAAAYDLLSTAMPPPCTSSAPSPTCAHSFC